MVRYLVAAIVLVPVLVLVVGQLLGRVRVQSCCAPADPARDLRMQQALTDGDGAP